MSNHPQAKPGKKSLRHLAMRLGILVHGNKLWVSELLSIIFVSSMLLIFFALTLLVVIDEAVIRSNDRTISALSSERHALADRLAEFSSKAKIVAVIRAFPGNQLTGRTCAQLADLVYASSTTYGYDPFLLLAVIRVESLFKSRAMGQYKDGAMSGAYGLMQIKLETAQQIAKNLGMSVGSASDLFRPDINVALGVAYLTRLISQFRSFKLGLLAYNQGPGVIAEYLQTRTPLSMEYYKRVLKSYYQFKKSVDTMDAAERKR
jgi:soluble lytic murein transglycosylase-like protein